jgi:hypothetical protein
VVVVVIIIMRLVLLAHRYCSEMEVVGKHPRSSIRQSICSQRWILLLLQCWDVKRQLPICAEKEERKKKKRYVYR